MGVTSRRVSASCALRGELVCKGISLGARLLRKSRATRERVATDSNTAVSSMTETLAATLAIHWPAGEA